MVAELNSNKLYDKVSYYGRVHSRYYSNDSPSPKQFISTILKDRDP